ncbi:hypothetical protein DL240_05045 [Lujinxingia litoralis]|uniref:Uncharacterized protein n=1 Tax=Lujinxingia litoralis TaxID=2211119 RepID=A0A328C7K2_9DELT|nr:hypothetical protein [Lujinxingia litoralis]RAL23530.1 hypothetical protein DL240_05045 [Lujinxingia litoralis]
MRFNKLPILSIALASLIGVAFTGATPSAQAQDDLRKALPDAVELRYRGLLQDESGAPISGVFPLEFNLYRDDMAAEPMWTEEHYVSVIEGRYQVPLGSHQTLRAREVQGERWLGVVLVGEGELLRDRLTIIRPGRASSGDANGKRISRAEVADRAIEAERAIVAESADALGELTVEEIERISNLALERLGQHIADPNAHEATARYKLGTNSQVLDGAGGTGGTHFSLKCPPGHVVTGIEGRAGRMLDYVTAICSPLQ